MQKPDNSTILNVCVLPSKEVGEECVKISQSLDQTKTLFALGDDKFPHTTVYMARFANDKIPEVTAPLDELMQTVAAFECRNTGYFMTAGRYLEVSYEKSDEFMEFHRLVMNKLSPLRINPGNPYEESYFAPYTANQERNAQNTGYDLANELYRPHITLTRYKEGQVPQETPQLPDVDLSFSLGRIGLYKADDNGAVYEEIKSFVVDTSSR